MSSPALSKRSITALGAVSGVVAAILALGVAELIAGVRQEWRSPVIDVGDRVIDNVPSSVKDFAIETFGTNDKPALLIGIGMTLLFYAAVIGALAFRRRIEIGLVGIGAFGLIGSIAATSNRVLVARSTPPSRRWSDLLPALPRCGAPIGRSDLRSMERPRRTRCLRATRRAPPGRRRPMHREPRGVSSWFAAVACWPGWRSSAQRRAPSAGRFAVGSAQPSRA